MDKQNITWNGRWSGLSLGSMILVHLKKFGRGWDLHDSSHKHKNTVRAWSKVCTAEFLYVFTRAYLHIHEEWTASKEEEVKLSFLKHNKYALYLCLDTDILFKTLSVWETD